MALTSRTRHLRRHKHANHMVVTALRADLSLASKDLKETQMYHIKSTMLQGLNNFDYCHRAEPTKASWDLSNAEVRARGLLIA